MAKTIPEQDNAAARAYLEQITRGWEALPEPAMIEMRCLFPDRTPDIMRFSPDQAGMDWLLEHAAVMNRAGLNTYVVVNPVRASAPLRRDGRTSGAFDEDIIAALHCWADADTAEAAENIRQFVGPRYSMHVLTGSQPFPRPHVYWRLDEPCRDLVAWTETQKAIAATLSTDRAVVNPSRIMRLPGMVNWPTEKKAAKGYVAEIATFRDKYPEPRPPIAFETMRRTFKPAAPLLSQLATPSGPPPSGASFQIDTGVSFDGPRKSADDYADILRRARTDGEKHTGVRDLAASLAGSGVPRALCEAMVREACPVWDHGVEKLIDTAYAKFFKEPAKPYTPNFDHAPAPTTSDQAPTVAPWRVQTAADFTADFVAPEYIIDGVVQRGRIYTLTAPTGSGKTAVMLYASTCIATGAQFGGRDVEQGDVLFLAGENPDDVRARVIATLEFHKIDVNRCRLHFIAGTFNIKGDIDRLREEAEKLPNLILVVVDTFAAYFPGDDENNNAQALDFARVIRGIAAFGPKPAVIMPAHPVKNASRTNLSPKGGSSLLNEVDGNLTLWNDEGVISMHWQGKFRGAEFAPMLFELQRFESSSLCDSQGRIIPTVLAKPVLTGRAMEIATENLDMQSKLLLNIDRHENMSQSQRAEQIGVKHQATVGRALRKAVAAKLIKHVSGSVYELTKDGEKMVSIIKSGGKITPDVEG